MTLSRRALRSAWLLGGCLWLLFVAYLSLTPRPPGAGLIPPDLGHFIAYAWLAIWFALLYRTTRTRIVLAFALCGYGVGLECLQLLTPSRHFSIGDMAINATGVFFGIVLMRTRVASTFDAIASIASGDKAVGANDDRLDSQDATRHGLRTPQAEGAGATRRPPRTP